MGAMDMFGAQAYPGVPSMGTIYDYGGPKNSFADPQAMALLGLAQGLFKAGAASPMPVGIGAALGQGIGGALSGAMGARQANQQQQLVDLEKAKADMTRQQLLQAQRQFQLQQGLLAKFGFTGDQTPASPTALAASPTAPIQPQPQATPAGFSPSSSNLIFGTPDFATPTRGIQDTPTPLPNYTPPQAGAPKPFPFSPTEIAALHLAGMPDLTGAYNAAQKNIKVANGVMYDTKDGKIVGTLPQTNQQGFSTITIPDPSAPGGYRVQTVQGGPEAYAMQQGIGEREKARYDLQTIPATSPNTPPTFNSRLNLVAPQAGGAPSAAGMSPAATSAQAADAAQQAEVAKNYGTIYNNLQNSAMANPAKIAKFQRIGNLLGDFEGGKLSKVGFDIARLGNSAGLKIDPKLPNKEAAEALANEAALDMRSTAGGGGMPGAMSDADREYLKNITPNMAQTAEGRKQIIESRVKLLQRENQVAGMARQYRKKYGKLDDDFFSQLQDWSNRNQIFAK